MRPLPCTLAVIFGFTAAAMPNVGDAAPAREFDGERAVAASDATAEPVTAAPTTTPEPASSPAAPSHATAPPASAAGPSTKHDSKASDTRPRRLPARLTIAGGPAIGPHTFGNEECRAEEARCETHGTFLGFGLNAELRLRLYRPLVGHVRGVLVGNVSPRDPVHRGLAGGGIGLGLYGRMIFGRAEYLFVDTFGDDHFARPFGDGQVGRDRWGHHAGLFSVGARLPFRGRWAAELWGGPMVGPRSTRSVPDEPDDRRTLVTFLVGINIAYDAIVGKR